MDDSLQKFSFAFSIICKKFKLLFSMSYKTNRFLIPSSEQNKWISQIKLSESCIEKSFSIWLIKWKKNENERKKAENHFPRILLKAGKFRWQWGENCYEKDTNYETWKPFLPVGNFYETALQKWCCAANGTPFNLILGWKLLVSCSEWIALSFGIWWVIVWSTNPLIAKKKPI